MARQPRFLFILKELPRPVIAVEDIVGGKEGVSGSLSSSLIVADRLSRRGNDVGVVVVREGQSVRGHFKSLAGLSEAMTWVDGGNTLWCSWGDEETLPRLQAIGCRPVVWLQVPMTPSLLQGLESGQLAGMIMVSDTGRLPFLHRTCHRRVGRAYNPLNPFFADDAVVDSGRYRSFRVVFAGHLSEYKGAHGALKMWRDVRRKLPNATLTLCGSNRLYGHDRPLGPHGVADPKFEEAYLAPLVREYGSLEDAGIRMAGLLSPAELKQLYHTSALGLVNCLGEPETFCCSAVEMLATGLPVLSFAQGSLPETIGQSGGAVLVQRPDLGAGAETLTAMIGNPVELERLGRTGRDYVRRAYECGAIAAHWEKLLAEGPEHLDRSTGAWGAGRSLRYYAERASATLGLQAPLHWGKGLMKRMLGRRES
jgi:hypothetical protein